MKNIIKRILNIVYAFLFVFVSLNVFSQSPTLNFSEWKIQDTDLSTGKLAFNGAETRTFKGSLTVQRFAANTPSHWSDVNFTYKFEVIRSGVEPISIYAEVTITNDNFEADKAFADINFAIDISSATAPNNINTLVINNDALGLFVKDSNFPNGWAQMTPIYPITVSGTKTPIVPGTGTGAITNNKICCDQCILQGETPDIIGQAAGLMLSGAVNNWSWEFKPEGYNNSGYISNKDVLSCSPYPTNRTVSYRRNLNSQRNLEDPLPRATIAYIIFNGLIYQDLHNYNAYVADNSNWIKITISSITASKTFPATVYPSSKTIKAGYITIRGNQSLTNLASGTVDFIAVRQIIITPDESGTVISPGINLTVDPSIMTCQSGGREESNMETEVKTEIEQSNDYFNAYPNPTHKETTITYKVAKKGIVKLYVTDNMGRLTANLIDNQNIEPGKYETTFDSRGLGSGVYFYTLITNGHSAVKRLVVINE